MQTESQFAITDEIRLLREKPQVVVTDEVTLLKAKIEDLTAKVAEAERGEKDAVTKLATMMDQRKGDKDLLYAMTDSNLKKDDRIARLEAYYKEKLRASACNKLIDNILCFFMGLVTMGGFGLILFGLWR